MGWALIAALLFAYLSGFFTLAALAYRHPSTSDEYRVFTRDNVELFHAAGRRRTANWAHIFLFIAAVTGALAVAFVVGFTLG